jgi:hypothetical protein
MQGVVIYARGYALYRFGNSFNLVGVTGRGNVTSASILNTERTATKCLSSRHDTLRIRYASRPEMLPLRLEYSWNC